MKNAFISGVSSGIGLGLAKSLISQGYMVYGVSRRLPTELSEHANFRFCSVDFVDTHAAEEVLESFIKREQIQKLTNVFLNVGQFGRRIAPIDQVSITDLNELIRVNVWSHKLVLDCLLANNTEIEAAIFSSSVAGVRARAGNSGYAITKAALNMMAKLYSLENPQIRFLVLGLCSVDTNLSETISTLPLEGNFPDIKRLRERAQAAGYMVSADKRAADILSLLDTNHKDHVPNGDFVEIRSLIA